MLYCPTVGFSGSGGIGEIPLHYRAISGKVLRSRAAEPLSAWSRWWVG
jgi:hypothetical protein